MSANDVVYSAQSQVGYLGKQSNASLESFTANPSGKYTKYGAWFGINPGDFCDEFVSWCAAQAGESEAVGKFAYVPSHIQFFKDQGRFFRRGEKLPLPGDVIFFEYGYDGVVDGDHVGLVEDCDGYNVYTIEGNVRDALGQPCVARRTYNVGYASIYGYGRPAYSEGSGGGEWTEWPEIKLFQEPKIYQNGSTTEQCFADVQLDPAEKTGSLNTWEGCKCLGIIGGRYLVLYHKDDTDDFKIGLCEYDGGVNP